MPSPSVSHRTRISGFLPSAIYGQTTVDYDFDMTEALTELSNLGQVSLLSYGPSRRVKACLLRVSITGMDSHIMAADYDLETAVSRCLVSARESLTRYSHAGVLSMVAELALG